MTRRDPIVEEVHAAREVIAKASQDDIEKIAAAARTRQNAGGRRIARLSPRRLAAEKKAK
jgi:hypothetical protein